MDEDSRNDCQQAPLLPARRAVTGAPSWEQWSLLAVVTGIFVHSQLYADLFEDPMLWTAMAAALAIGITAGVLRADVSAPSATDPE